MGDGQVAARPKTVTKDAHGTPWVVAVSDEVQDGDHQHGHRLREVQETGNGRVLEDLLRATQVSQRDTRAGDIGQEGPTVGNRYGVEVHVGDPHAGVECLGRLVHAADGGKSGADVQELSHTHVDQVRDRAPKERPVRLHDHREVRPQGDRLPGKAPVGREVVESTQVVVVDARCAGQRRIHALRHDGTARRDIRLRRHASSSQSITQGSRGQTGHIAPYSAATSSPKQALTTFASGSLRDTPDAPGSLAPWIPVEPTGL